MRSLALLAAFSMAAIAGPAAPTAWAGGLGCLLHQHCDQGCGCPSCCKVYVHVCKVPPSEAAEAPRARETARRPEAAAAGAPLSYAPIVPSVPYMAMPMMAAQPVVYAAPQQARAPEAGGCDACGRLDRLESALKNLNERMDKMENILQEHTEAIKLLIDRQAKQ